MALVPIAIFATANKDVKVSNHVKYYVEDLNGDFYYAITGNANDELNTGYSNNIIQPAHLFTAKFDADLDEYLVFDSMNNLVEDKSIPVPKAEKLEFDKEHKTISYYFFFINKAEEVLVDEKRAVILKPRADVNFDTSLVTGQWEYSLKTALSVPTYITPNDIAGTLWISESEETAHEFVDGIKVEAKDKTSGLYNYIILRYTLTLQEEKPFSANVNLTITLDSETQTN